MESKKNECVIYCRVSSQRQVDEGHGLEGQEKRCRSFAQQNGYEVLAVFRDAAVSGALIQRPGMQKMLDFLDARPKTAQEIVVLVDDIKRLARNVQGHLTLKTAVTTRNARFESPSHRFEDTPEGIFIELILAGASQLERDQNKRQVINRMKARMEAGYWSFYPVPGYLFEKDPVHGKVLKIDKSKARVIKEALEGFANNRFLSQMDIKKFLENEPTEKRIHLEYVKRLLSRSLFYAGIIEYSKWEITARKGFHEPLISLETHRRIQDKLDGKVRRHQRKDANPDFPLRGFVLCPKCHKPMTAAWSKGRSKRFPYYRCKTDGCERKHKGIPREKIEGEFLKILKTAKPQAHTLKLIEKVILDIWKKKSKEATQRYKKIQRRKEEAMLESKDCIERIARLKNPLTIKAYERKINTLEKELNELEQKMLNLNPKNFNFGTAWELVRNFIKNPVNIWQNGQYTQKQLVLNLVFAEPLEFDYNSGFGTANFSLPFEIFLKKCNKDFQVVDMVGIEPTWQTFFHFLLRVQLF